MKIVGELMTRDLVTLKETQKKFDRLSEAAEYEE